MTYIGAHVFQDCPALTTVKFGGGLAEIGGEAFKNTGISLSGDSVLPASLTTIGRGAFENCPAITSVAVPAASVNLGEDIFKGCAELASATVSGTIVGQAMFADCTKLAGVSLPSAVTLRRAAFANDTSLTSVTLGGSLRWINDKNFDYGAFEGCTALESITIPASVRRIGRAAFSGCTKLADLTMNKGLLEIGREAFYDCQVLATIDIPNTVVRIEEDAFGGNNRTGTTTILWPNSVREVAHGRFTTMFSGRNPMIIRGYKSARSTQGQLTAKDIVDQRREWDDTNLTFEDREETEPEKVATGISFPYEVVELEEGQFTQLAPTLAPADSTDAIEWEAASGREINQMGEFTAGDYGDYDVVAKTTHGKEAVVRIKVSAQPWSVDFPGVTSYRQVIYLGDTHSQAARVKDRAGNPRTDIAPVYTSDNPSIATVDPVTGVVTAVSEGYVTITASFLRKDGEKAQGSYYLRIAKKSTDSSGGGGSTDSNTGNTDNTSGKILPVGIKQPGEGITAKSLGKVKKSVSGKVLVIKTVPGAQITISAKKSILGVASKMIIANKKGQARFGFKKKIKKVTVNVCIIKAGYKMETFTWKFK